MQEGMIKSRDTEEWIDRVYTRPVAQTMVPILARLGVSPNAVTLTSWAVGVAGAVCFYASPLNAPEWWLHVNVLGVCLLTLANFLDSADGQLARQTGQCSPLGRILDGASGDVWYFFIYWALYLRLIPQLQPAWGVWAVVVPFVLGCFDGFVVHVHQCRLADYYRNIHLYFLGTRNELHSYANVRAEYDAVPWRGHLVWKFFHWLYVNYTRAQEQDTPQFQRLRSLVTERYGADIPLSFRERFRQCSKPILWCTNAMVFNQRALALYVACLLDRVWIVFFFEVGYLGAVYIYMHLRHERFCRRLANELAEA